MSPETLPTGKGRLIVTGPPGYEIQVMDGQYQAVGRGAERLDLILDGGVYVTRWIGPSAVKERIDLLLAIETPLVIDCPADERARTRASSVFDSLATPMAETVAHNSAIVVLEESDVSGVKGALSKDLRLFNCDDIAMRSRQNEVEAQRQDAGADEAGTWALRVYPVPAGVYRIRFSAVSGETLDQAVIAVPGRRTIVVLRQAVARSLVKSGSSFTPVYHRGAEPSRTVIMSVPIVSEGPPAADQLALAESLLVGLSLGGDPLAETNLQRIREPGSDPLARLYAAWVIAQSLRLKTSPTMDRPYPAEPTQALVFDRHWRDVGKELLADLPHEMREYLDVAVCHEALLSPIVVPPSKSPPMLAATFAYIVGQATYPGADPKRHLTSLEAEMRGPWVVRRAAAAKGGEVMMTPPNPVAAAFGSNIGLEAPRAGPFGKAVWDGVTKYGQAWGWGLVIYVIAIVGSAIQNAFKPGTPIFDLKPDWVWLRKEDEGPTLPVIKASLSDLTIPPWVLETLLPVVAIVLTVAAAAAAGWSIYREIRARRSVPGLARPVQNPDDPHKGRFGQAASRDGVTLSASFKPAGDKWVDVELLLTADTGSRVHNGDEAVFFLHPTFNPDRVSERFRDGKARLSIKAWGGFTVGVWLPVQKIELELDLAELTDAPPVIKEW